MPARKKAKTVVAAKTTAPTLRPAPAAPSSTSRRAPVDLGQALVHAWRVNERINQELLALVPAHIWRAFPACSKRRNIATSFAHIHNVRCMRIKMTHSTVAVPERLDREDVTPEDARKALAVSADAMLALIRVGLEAGGLVPNYRPDVVAMTCGAMLHEAHHRGQIAHWCRELGAPIAPEQALRLWEWDKIHKLVNREA